MKKLILVIAFLGLFSIPSIAQVNINLGGGVSCSLNIPNSITVTEGSFLYVTATTSGYSSFYWSVSPAKYTFIHPTSNLSASSTVKVEFTKAGVYNLSVMVIKMGCFGGSYATVTVLPKTKKVSYNYLEQ